jgi:dipeptidyl aminopeptidase/acylaminoacyl peptidase
VAGISIPEAMPAADGPHQRRVPVDQGVALSRQLAAESLVIASSDAVTARRLAVAAWSVSHAGQAQSAMTTLLIEQQPNGILRAGQAGYGLTQVAFSPGGTLLATADADGTIQLWNLATGQLVGAALYVGIGFPVNGVAFSPDGKQLAAADADGTVRMLPVALFTDPYGVLCAQVGPPTGAEWAQYAPGEPQPAICK